MPKYALFVVIAAVFILSGLVWFSGPSLAQKPESDIGRYQMATSVREGGPIFVTVIDTTDGRIVLQKRINVSAYEYVGD